MNFDLPAILESKRLARQRLAERPIGEKLRLLDALRERELTLRGRPQPAKSNHLHEPSPPYQTPGT